MESLGRFDWDQANIQHIARHGVTPEEAEQVLRNDPVEVQVQLRSGETRTLCLGQTDAGRLVTVVYAIRRNCIRVVTAHPMNHKQREVYESQKQN